jgi:spore germination cell wall hydrolase CwlJ-like protein
MGLLKNLIPVGTIVASLVVVDANAAIQKHIPKPYVPDSVAIKSSSHMSSKDRSCLIIAAWNEARGRTDKEATGVMSAVLNRVKHPDFPKTVCGVVLEQGQFEMAWKIRKTLRLAKSGHSFRNSLGDLQPADEEALDRLDMLAGKVIKGYVADPTKGATHFYTPSVRRKRGLPADPLWAKKMTRTASIGEFRFVKERKKS